MSLNSLLNVPRNERDWERWSFNNRQDLDEIRTAIRTQFGVSVQEYVLDPIPRDDVPRWLTRNQETLNQINGILNLRGSDLEGVDLNDPRQLQGWIFEVYQQHFTARAALKI